MMSDIAMEQTHEPGSFSEKIKVYARAKRDEAIATLRHWLRADGFPTPTVIEKRGPLPKVMVLYYFCTNCETMVEVNRHLECEICGSRYTRPAHKVADEKHDISLIMRKAQLEMAHGEALRRNEQMEMEKALEGSM